MSESVLSMYDNEFLYAYDLDGKDVTVCIERVKQGEIDSHRKGEKPTKKPVLYFKGKEKGLMLCITNTRSIIALYGTDKAAEWAGKWITLFPTTTTFGSKTVDCIRVRPVIPKRGKSQPLQADSDGVVQDPPPPSDTNGDAQ